MFPLGLDKMIIRVTPKSGKGKNRIREYGHHWRVLKTSDQVVCREGRSHLVESLGRKYWRWVSTSYDPDFNIEEVIND